MGAQGKIQFLVGDSRKINIDSRYCLAKKKGGGGVKGGIDAVMHTMKLDVLLHKTRIKVPRFGICTYMISLSKIAHQLWHNIGRGEGVIK